MCIMEDSLGDWIATLVQRCLSFYLEGPGDADLEMEDDGSNLRFTNPISRSAVIYQYLSPREGRVQTLKLIDENTQIEAILSSDSLDAYNRESPDRPLQSYNPTQYRIRLEGHEIVFEYSMSQPKVHLYVKKFSIEWERGKVTPFRARKQLRKRGHINNQMNMVFGRVKQAQRRLDTADSADSSERSIKSQNDDHSKQKSPDEEGIEAGISQEGFMSQVPSGHRLASSGRVSNRLLSNLGRPSVAEDVMSNALSVPGPPEDAKLGSKDMPWLRLTEREITELRGKLRKTAEWQPSEDLINYELTLRGRGSEAYKNAKARAEAEGAEFVDCDDIENSSTASGLNPSNGNNEPIELNKLKKPNRSMERQLDVVVREEYTQRSASANGHQMELQCVSSTEKPAGQSSKNYFDRQETDLRKTPSQSASTGEEQPRDNHMGSTGTKSDPKPARNRTAPATSREVEVPMSRVVEIRSAETNKGPRGSRSNAEPESTAARPEEPIKESVETGSMGSHQAENASNESDAKGSDGQSNSERQNPWEGLKRLRSRDVKVPRDQHKLLEDHRQWMPALLGKSDPRGHVPPDLLAQWNRIVLLRNLRANGSEQGSKSPRPPAPDSCDSPSGDPDSAPETDSDGGTQYSWSPSPAESRPRSELPANNQLPADSPLSERRRTKKSSSPRPGEDVGAEEKLPEDVDSSIHSNNEQDRYTISERSEAHRAHTQNSRQVDEPVDASAPEPTPAALTQNHEGDSDNESDESAMDAAVPCPLGDNLQAELPVEQTDQDPTSLRQWLPQRDRYEHVQAVDTPAANLTHRLSEKPAKENTANNQQESSQAAISSSQSRIFNTYASHGTSMCSSQEPHFSPQMNGDNESTGIDIMGTQMSGEICPTQSTSNSHSGFVPNSSGPERREASILVGTQTEGNSELRTEARMSEDNDRQVAESWAELEKIVGSEALEVLKMGGQSYPYTVQLRKTFEDDLNEGIRKLTQAVVTRLRSVRSDVPAFLGIRSNDAWEAEKMSGEEIPDSELAELGLVRGPGGLPVRKRDVEENDQEVDAILRNDEDHDVENVVDDTHDGELQTTELNERKVPPTAMFPSDDENLGPTVLSSAWDSSMGGTREDVKVPNLKRLASVFETEEASPSKRQRTEPIGGQNAESIRRRQNKRPTSNIMSRRESYINSTADRAEAMRAYEKFRSDYPIYSGEFSHFIELCSKLQSLRDRGHLKRSFLWDDFIIMHLDQYPSYLQLCQEMDSKSMDYEEYFSVHFSIPTYKKRSLTANGIEVSAAHCLTTSQPSVAASSSISRGETNGTITTSFVNKLSEFHVDSSFGPETQNDHIDIESDRLSATASLPPTPLKRPQRNAHTLARSLVNGNKPQLSQQSSHRPSRQPSRQPSLQPTIDRADNSQTADVAEPCAPETTVDESVAEDYDSTLDEMEARRQLLMENAQALSAEQTITDVVMTEGNTEEPAAGRPPEIESTPEPPGPVVMTTEHEVEPSIPESDHEDDIPDEQPEIYDEMEETHSTASIELGDEPSTISQEPRSDTREAEASEKVDVNEGWFASLRHIRPPTGPVWSDDPNTPFKLWARADQNVKIEVSRRGGRYRDVDNKGVIQPSTTLRSVP